MKITDDFETPFVHPELRLQYVPRWAIINMDRQQSVAEHCYNVAIIVSKLANKKINYSVDLTNQLMVEALQHDSSEAFTGDIPSPAKAENDDGGAHPLVKLADLIEAYRYSQRHCNDTERVKYWIKYYLRSGIIAALKKTPLTYTDVSSLMGE